MRASQFEILDNELSSALKQVNSSELSRCSGHVEIVLEEYDNLDKASKVKLSPVSYLSRQLANHTYLDISLFNLVIAQILTNRIRLNIEESNSELVNYGIAAINNWKNYRKKHELADKRRTRENAARKSEGTRKARDTKTARHRELWKRIRELYEPVIAELHCDDAFISYKNIAQRIAPKVETLNKVGEKKYLLGGKDDPVGAIKERLEKGRREGEIDSPLVYRKKKPDL